MLNRKSVMLSAPAGRPATSFTSERARHAVDVALKCLRQREQDERVRALARRAETLRNEIERWHAEPPSMEVREGAMLRALSIHLEAVALSRKT